jgi:hypothetical protein
MMYLDISNDDPVRPSEVGRIVADQTEPLDIPLELSNPHSCRNAEDAI